MTYYELATLILQGVIAIAAFATLAVYYHQLRVMDKQLQATQASARAQSALSLAEFLQLAEVRAARHCVRSVLSQKPIDQWSDEERRHASLVTANYDVAAALLKAGLVPTEVIVPNWGPSICHCYEVLFPFILELRKKAGGDPCYWSNFEWLYNKSKQSKIAIVDARAS